MTRLELIIIVMLQFEAISGQTERLYKRAGEDVVFSCKFDASSSQCSYITWIHEDYYHGTLLTKGLKMRKSSAKASRLSVSSNCSLIIRNITDEDAGRLGCNFGPIVSLYILSISPSPLDVYRRLRLSCSLTGFKDSCEQYKIIWLDETGTEQPSEDVHIDHQQHVHLDRHWKCSSVLMVKHTESSKRFTCQIVENNKVKIDAAYHVTVSLAGSQLNLVKHFRREGQDILLSCGFEGCSDQCANLTWMHRRHVLEDDLPGEQISFEGKVNQSLPRASRMNLTSNCSLLIRNLHVEDAGFYGCGNYDLLNILSISSSPSDVAERVDLTCSLHAHSKIETCHPVRIIWVDETGTELSGKNAEFEVNLQDNCVSILTVKRQSGNKKFTCKVVEDNKVMIDAVYILTE